MNPVSYPKCVNCGLPFIPPEPGQLTCSPRCAKERHKHLDRVRRGVQGEENRPLRNQRRCESCGSRLSAYNRGTYCHGCWEKLSLRQRTAVIARNPKAEPVHGRRNT
jgi:hypothetical protein